MNWTQAVSRPQSRVKRHFLRVYRFLYRNTVARMMRERTGDVWVRYEGFRLKLRPPDLVSRQIANNGVYEIDEKLAIERNVSEGDTVFDIGAHVGSHTLTMRKCVGTSGEVYAAEPLDRAVQLMRATVRENGFDNVHLISKAVGEQHGSVTLRVNGENSGSSTVVPGEKRDWQGHEVEMTTIESIVNKFGVNKIDFMKIDVQGSEADVVAGSNLDRIRSMLIEIHGSNGLSNDEVVSLYRTLDDWGTVYDLTGKELVLDSLTDRNRDFPIIWKQE